MINGVIDMMMIPYGNMVIFHCCNAITLKPVDLYCVALMSGTVTADTILNESFILMTHLASWKPLVRSRYLWSSCMGGYLMHKDTIWLKNIYVPLRHEDKDASSDKHDNLTLISLRVTAWNVFFSVGKLIWLLRSCCIELVYQFYLSMFLFYQRKAKDYTYMLALPAALISM